MIYSDGNMKVKLHPRAEIQLRSLSGGDQKRLGQALSSLAQEQTSWNGNPKLPRLDAGTSSKALYIYRASSEFRFILSFEAGDCTVEDVVYRSRLSPEIAIEASTFL